MPASIRFCLKLESGDDLLLRVESVRPDADDRFWLEVDKENRLKKNQLTHPTHFYYK
jgi:hypothetical protein